jgi:multidrug transporter EmrE-like cation transporter
MTRYIPLILFTVLTNAAAQILLKRGMISVGGFSLGGASAVEFALRTLLNPFVLLGLVTFVVSMLSHLIVLSRVELSYAYPFLSLAYVVVTAYAFFVFREDVGAMRLLGIGLICLGTICIARS